MRTHRTKRTRRTIRALAAAAALGLTVLAGNGAAAQQGSSPSPDGTADLKMASVLVQPSVVYLTITVRGYVFETSPRISLYLDPRSRDRGGSPFTATGSLFSTQVACTGFVVNPEGWIATAGHCVDPAEAKIALKTEAATWAVQNNIYSEQYTVEQLTGKLDTYRIDNYAESGKLVRGLLDEKVRATWGGSVSGSDLVKNKPASIEGLRKYDVGDVALLKVDETSLNAVPVAEAGTELSINDSVVSIGYPGVIKTFTDPDLIPTFNNGTITSLKTVGDGLLSVYQTNADIKPGMSGGPTVDGTGTVVGVNSSYYQGTSFNYAFPADQLRQLMGSTGVTNELSDTTQQYRSGITAYFSGDKQTAVDDLQAVVDEQPANAVAADYLERAQGLSSSDGGGVSTWVWVAAGAVLVAVVVTGVVVLVTRRRRQPGPVPPAPEPAPPVTQPAPTGAGASRSEPETGAAVGGTGEAPTVAEPPPRTTPAGFGAAAPTVPGTQPVAAAARFCTACGAQAAPGNKYCGACGSPM